jgi:orotidine-5'-phosphate decarboxylase
VSIEKVFCALDNMSKDEVLGFIDRADGKLKNIKVGMELYYAEGPLFLEELQDKYNLKVFLDLKLHDIPNTVAKAIKSLKGLPVHFLTIHTSGGTQMIKAALESARENLPSAKILGVSYLTSLAPEDLKEMWDINQDEIPKAFERFFDVGMRAGIDGFILSPLELEILKAVETKHSTQVLKVTPGIRFADEIASGKTQDQKRVLSPEEALANGADYLVMGRSLNQADNLNERIEQLKAIR